MGETQFNAVQSKQTRSPTEPDLRRSDPEVVSDGMSMVGERGSIFVAGGLARLLVVKIGRLVPER
jgi:hypothetical protein